MAKKTTGSRINLGLDSNILDRLNRASQAKAGVGEFKQTSFGEGLGNIAANIGGKLLDDQIAKTKKQEKSLKVNYKKALKLLKLLALGKMNTTMALIKSWILEKKY